MLATIATMVMVVIITDQQTRAATFWVEHTHKVVVGIETVVTGAEGIETGERGFLLTNNAAFLEPYDRGVATVWASLRDLQGLIADNPAQRQRVGLLSRALQAQLAIVDHLIRLGRDRDRAGITDMMSKGADKLAMDDVRQNAKALVDAESDPLRQRVIELQDLQRWTEGLLVGLLIIVAGGIFLTGILAIRGLLGDAETLRGLTAAAEREQLLAMTDLAAVLWRDPPGIIQFWSEGCRRIYGWTAEQVVGRSMHGTLHSDSAEALARIDAALLRDGEWSGERRDRRSDGAEIIVMIHKIERRDAAGRVFAVVETVTDVTALRETEAELRASHARFHSVVDAAPDAIVVADAHGRIQTVNQAATRMFGYDHPDALIGRDLGVLMPAIEAARHGTYIANHRAGPAPRVIDVPGRELLAIRQDGSAFPIDLSVSSFVVDGQHCLTGIIRDVTTRKRAEMALRDSEARQQMMHRIGGLGFYDRVLSEPTGLISGAFNRLYGLPPEQTHLSTADAFAFIHPEERAQVVAALDRLFEGGPALTFEGRIIRSDGSVRWLSVNTAIVLGSDGLPSRVVSAQWDITEIVQAREILAHRNEDLEQRMTAGTAALVKSEEHTRLALSAVNSIGTFDWDIVNDRVSGNGSSARIFGLDTDRAAAGAPLAEYLCNVPADARAKMLLEYQQAMRTGGDCSVIHPVNQADGSVRWCMAKSHCILAPDGTPLRMSGVLIDITDQRVVEEQLRQSQKMEAVGQLTGGLAHDFNNMLQGITGSLELLKLRLAAGRNVDRYIAAAQGDAARAATLTQRLLAFSRRQVLDPVTTNADELVAGLADLIQRTVGPAIKTAVVPTNGLWTTLCDVNQMENALLNLCINARDAMPDGGRLTIETANVSLDRRNAFDWDVTPGEYVAVCVTDSGIGMPQHVVARAFDPFFTTKPLGAGTGLGLAMIYGFAQQSGGQARIYSEVGIGTTVRIYLPRHLVSGHRSSLHYDADGDAAEPQPLTEKPAHQPGHGQTVLIVDDEQTVRMLVTDVLREQGYAAIEAVDGASGLKILQSNARIDLLISDVGLPGGMDGRQMADAARLLRPDLKVLFITGYAPSAVVDSRRLDLGMQVMTKPFTLDSLAARIKDMISEVETV